MDKRGDIGKEKGEARRIRRKKRGERRRGDSIIIVKGGK